MSEPSRAELKYQVERQREEIITINTVGKLLSSATDPLELWHLIADFLRSTFPIAVAALILPGRKVFDVLRFTTILDPDLEPVLAAVKRVAGERLGPAGNAADLQPVIQDARHSAGDWAHATLRQLQSEHSAVITQKDQSVGLLFVYSGKPEAFQKDDRHAIDIVADQLSAALQNAFLLEELRQANAIKQDLLMVISHELRTPLTSIKEGVNLVLDGTLGEINADQADFLKTVDSNTDRLWRLVERSVLASQLVTEQLLFKKVETNLNDLLRAIALKIRDRASAKGVTVAAELSVNPLLWLGDGDRLRQAIEQIVENAVQATPSGGSVRLISSREGEAMVLKVTDTGPGIAEEDLARMFDKFRIVGTVDDRKTGGLGLGLFIAYQLITRQGGTLAIESALGAGTTVTARLNPRAESPSA